MASSLTAGQEASGINLIKRAVELDSQKRYTECLICYQEGIQLLMQVMKDTNTSEPAKAAALRKKISEYMDRAEFIKNHVETNKISGKYHEQITIKENAVGFSYESVMSRFLAETCQKVEIDDPYIRSHHQIVNFLRFCELLVKKNCGIKTIKLRTGLDSNDSHAQKEKLRNIADSLKARDIQLIVEFSDTLHDREIRLSNHWVIKIGRGLDYFKPAPGKFSIGTHDYDLRSCHETTIDIFYKLQ